MTYSKILARMTREATNSVHISCSVETVENDETFIVYVGSYRSPKMTQREAIDMLAMVKACGTSAVRPLYPMHGGLIQ